LAEVVLEDRKHLWDRGPKCCGVQLRLSGMADQGGFVAGLNLEA
jgi:hypothetical protein